jgi:hypothetical protein
MQVEESTIAAIPLKRYSVVFNDMESHYNTLLNTIPGIVYTLDEKGHFTYISSNVESAIGYSLNDLIGRHFSYIICPEDVYMVSRDHILPRFAGVPTGAEKSPKLFDERRTTDRKTTGLNLRIRARSTIKARGKQNLLEDKFVSCKVNASGQYLKNGAGPYFCGTVGFIFDIADDNSMTSAIESRKRYNALDLLAHALAHAFSNVFTGIYGNLQLMEMQLKEKNQLAGNIDAIKHSIENAISLIKQVTKSLSEPAAKKGGNFICDVASEIAVESFKGSRQFEISNMADLWDVEADPDYIRHVLRSVFFHVGSTASNESIIKIHVENYDGSPLELLRQDCRYIQLQMRFAIEDIPADGCSVLTGHTRALDKIAAMALNYALLKKIGGSVVVSGEGNDALVTLLLPSVQRVETESFGGLRYENLRD